MFKRVYYAIAGDPNEKALNRFHPLVEQVNELEPSFEKKSNEELRAMTTDFRARIMDETAELRRLFHRPPGMLHTGIVTAW